MRHILRLFPVVAIALAARPLAAAPTPKPQWKDIGTTSSGNHVFVDPKSIKRDKAGVVQAKVKLAYTTPVQTPQGAQGSQVSSVMVRCADRTFAVKERTTYSVKNAVLEHTVNKIPGFGPAIGGSVTEIAVRYLCSQK